MTLFCMKSGILTVPVLCLHVKAVTGQKQEVKQTERELAELRDETANRDQPSSLTQQISTLEVQNLIQFRFSKN